jgi:hypothetical protein
VWLGETRCTVFDETFGKANGAFEQSSLATARQAFRALIGTLPEGPALAD